MKPTVKIVGDRELYEWFKGLDEGMSGIVMVNALKVGAMPIQNAAKEKSPKKTRNLSRSIHTEVTVQTDSRAEVIVGTDVVYAAIHEFGGVITPKNSKYLAIPVSENARIYGSPRNYPTKLVFRPGVGGGVLTDPGKTGKVHYVLRRSVTIPARPYLRPALDENEDRATNEIARALRVQLEKIVYK